MTLIYRKPPPFDSYTKRGGGTLPVLEYENV